MDDRGQAVTEYLLMLFVVVGAALLLLRGVRASGFGDRLTSWMMGSYRASYKYGHPKAKGFNEGGPEFLPLAAGGRGQGNGRLFISPEAR